MIVISMPSRFFTGGQSGKGNRRIKAMEKQRIKCPVIVQSRKRRDWSQYPRSSASTFSSAAIRFSRGGWVEKSSMILLPESAGMMKNAFAP